MQLPGRTIPQTSGVEPKPACAPKMGFDHPVSPLEARHLRDLAANATDLSTRCRYILRYISRQQGKLIYGLSPQALAALGCQPWSGDLSELERTLWTAVENCEGRVILPAHLVLEQHIVEDSLQASKPLNQQVDTKGELPGHQIPTPSVGHGDGVGHEDGGVVQEPALPHEVTEPPFPSALPFVDLGLLSARHLERSDESSDVGVRPTTFRLQCRRRVLAPTTRRISLANTSTAILDNASPEPVGSSTVQTTTQPPPEPTIRPLAEALEELERQLITQALHAVDQNLSQAAELLRIPRQTLHYRMKALGLDQSSKPPSRQVAKVPSGKSPI